MMRKILVFKSFAEKLKYYFTGKSSVKSVHVLSILCISSGVNESKDLNWFLHFTSKGVKKEQYYENHRSVE